MQTREQQNKVIEIYIQTKRMKILAVTALATLLIFTSCNKNDDITTRLNQAEQTLEEDPDKAFRDLDAIDVSKFKDSSTISRWTSLYGDALMASGIASIDGNESLQARYVNKLRECSERRENYEKHTSAIISALMIIILALFLAYLNRRVMFHHAKDEVLITRASSLQSAVKCNRLLLTRRQEVIHDGFAERIANIDRLCDDYYELARTGAHKYSIVKELAKVMDSMKCNTEAFMLFEGAVNDRRPQLLGLLRKELPNLTSNDYRLYVYLSCGMSAQTISMLTGDSVATVYYNRNRLRKQIEQLSPDSMRILQEMI
jgi:hypothetical protein